VIAFQKLEAYFARKKQMNGWPETEVALLLLDNAQCNARAAADWKASHPNSTLRIFFLEANVTDDCQVMDATVIACFKQAYAKLLNKYVVDQVLMQKKSNVLVEDLVLDFTWSTLRVNRTVSCE